MTVIVTVSRRSSELAVLFGKEPEGAIFEAGTQYGFGFMAFSPLAHGTLSGKYVPGKPPPAGSRAADESMSRFMETAGRHYRSDSLLRAVSALSPIAEEVGVTMAQMALAWVLRRSEVTTAIIGASHPEQIAENVGAVGVALPVEVLERIDDVVDGVVVKP